LFDVFTQHLLLPQAWPVTTNPFFTSGGIHLGNLNLELMQAGTENRVARWYGIAFQLAPFMHSLPALQERGIPHTPTQPFYLVDDQGWQETAWTSVFLGGLLGDSAISRLFFRVSRRAPAETWEKGSLPTPFNRRFALPFLFDTVYRSGITYAVEYNPAWYARNVKEEPTLTGLEVKGVYEVCIGVRDFNGAHSCWQALFAPYPEVSRGIWRLPGEMHVRLVPAKVDGLKRVTLQVYSLNRAVQFLNKRQMLGAEKNGMARISRKATYGLDVRLVQ
jgi:hypothetical protein